MHNLTPEIVLHHLAAGRLRGVFGGVVLFVDVSGFTPLTAALTAHGHEGAEVLADILLAVLEPLLELIHAHGGFVAGFAGDAFKAVFPEDGEAQALAAASAIHRHMATHRHHTTPFGVFSFAVRAAIANGDVRWQIWPGDDPHAAQSHAYTFSGSALDGALHGADHVAAGELVITEDVHARLALHAAPPASLPLSGAATGYRRVLEIHDHPALAPIPAKEDALPLDLAARFFPLELLNASTQGEFRPVVSVFCNVDWSDAAGDDFVRLLLQLLARYGGYLCRFGRIGGADRGGTFLLFWGAPTAHENDVDRALGCLLDLRAQSRLPLRAGVSSGVAYVGFVGSARHEEYTCYGLHVNLAARQMGAAGWGDIWLDEPTARRAGAFDVAPAGRFVFKGFDHERSVFSLLGRRRGLTAVDSNLVGRAAERTQLRQAALPLFAGHFAGVTVVVGEAGIGKSRLLDDLRRQLEDDLATPVSWLRCPADEILRRPLQPWRAALRTYFDQQPNADEDANQARFDAVLDDLLAHTDDPLRAELQRTRSFLAALLDLESAGSLYAQVDPRLRFENTLSALSVLLRAHSRRRPLVVEIEDLHWIDDDSRRCVQRLVDEARDEAIWIVASSRQPPDAAFFGAGIEPRLIEPGPLTPEALGQLAADLLGDAIAPSLVMLLAARSEGNPFFAEQILLYLQEEKLLTSTVQGLAPVADLAHLPPDVHAVLVARLDRLAQRVREVVQTAAVLGREFAVDVLARMLHRPLEVDDSLRVAEEEAIWTALGELRYLFRHALLREAAYDMQLRARLRALHRLAAEAIEQMNAADLAPHYADLAYHYRHAGLSQRERTFARLAGARAADTFANADAVAHFSRALDLTPPAAHADRFDLLVERVHVYERQGARPLQRADLDALATLATTLGDTQRQAEVALLDAEYFEAMSDFAAAQTAAQRALDLSTGAGQVRLTARAHQHLGRSLWRQGDFAASEAQAQASLRLAQAGGLRELEADALIVLGIARWFVGDYALAEDYLRRSLPIYTEIGKPVARASVWQNLGLVAQNRGDHNRALSYLERALVTYRQTGSRQNQAISLSNLAYSYQRIGDYDRALSSLQRALAIFNELDEAFGRMIATGSLGGLHLTLGLRAAARTYYDEALALCLHIGSRGYDSMLAAVLAEIDFADGHAAAFHRLHAALDATRAIGRRDNVAKILMKVGRVALALDRLDEAAAAYTEAADTRTELGQPLERVEALAGLAQVALAQQDVDRAAVLVAEIRAFLAHNAIDGAFSPFDLYLTCYRVLDAIADPAALEMLADGYELLQRHAAHIADDAMRRSFLEDVETNRLLAHLFRSRA